MRKITLIPYRMVVVSNKHLNLFFVILILVSGYHFISAKPHLPWITEDVVIEADGSQSTGSQDAAGVNNAAIDDIIAEIELNRQLIAEREAQIKRLEALREALQSGLSEAHTRLLSQSKLSSPARPVQQQSSLPDAENEQGFSDYFVPRLKLAAPVPTSTAQPASPASSGLAPRPRPFPFPLTSINVLYLTSHAPPPPRAGRREIPTPTPGLPVRLYARTWGEGTLAADTDVGPATVAVAVAETRRSGDGCTVTQSGRAVSLCPLLGPDLPLPGEETRASCNVTAVTLAFAPEPLIAASATPGHFTLIGATVDVNGTAFAGPVNHDVMMPCRGSLPQTLTQDATSLLLRQTCIANLPQSSGRARPDDIDIITALHVAVTATWTMTSGMVYVGTSSGQLHTFLRNCTYVSTVYQPPASATLLGEARRGAPVTVITADAGVLAFGSGSVVRFASATRHMMNPTQCEAPTIVDAEHGGVSVNQIASLAFDVTRNSYLFAGMASGDVLLFNTRARKAEGGFGCRLLRRLTVPHAVPQYLDEISFSAGLWGGSVPVPLLRSLSAPTVHPIRGYVLVSSAVQGVVVYNTSDINHVHRLFASPPPSSTQAALAHWNATCTCDSSAAASCAVPVLSAPLLSAHPARAAPMVGSGPGGRRGSPPAPSDDVEVLLSDPVTGSAVVLDCLLPYEPPPGRATADFLSSLRMPLIMIAAAGLGLYLVWKKRQLQKAQGRDWQGPLRGGRGVGGGGGGRGGGGGLFSQSELSALPADMAALLGEAMAEGARGPAGVAARQAIAASAAARKAVASTGPFAGGFSRQQAAVSLPRWGLQEDNGVNIGPGEYDNADDDEDDPLSADMQVRLTQMMAASQMRAQARRDAHRDQRVDSSNTVSNGPQSAAAVTGSQHRSLPRSNDGVRTATSDLHRPIADIDSDDEGHIDETPARYILTGEPPLARSGAAKRTYDAGADNERHDADTDDDSDDDGLS